MASEFTREDVEAIARLAHFDLTPEEADLFAKQLGEFLAYAQAVQGVDTSGVPPTAAVIGGGSSERADEMWASLDRDRVLDQAPDPAPDRRFFRVPRVIG
jgi:aspartyl-tRNA(Asn)/glutamyl-tRNA(Gln) amidotransferase subunit C